MDTYVYKIGNNLYVNLTNRCSNRCTFCVRNGKETFEGYALWLREGEPTAEQVMAALGECDCEEVVFCGFGEPTIKLDVLLKVAKEIKARGGVTRINTNGQANMIHKRDVTGELAACIDKINVSLNEATAEDYVKLCRPAFGEAAFAGLQDFAKKCAQRGIDTWFSVVDVIGEEKIGQCRRIARECGVALRVRAYIG